MSRILGTAILAAILSAFIPAFPAADAGPQTSKIPLGMPEADVNDDGQVGLADAVTGLKLLTGTIKDASVSVASDVNGDEKIGLAEVIWVRLFWDDLFLRSTVVCRA